VSTSSPHVLIVGGGLGGLCLAQGLRRGGVAVSVHERDASSFARHQGYRIRIDSRGVRGLRHCLPPQLFDLFVMTAGQPGHQFTVVNERLRQLHVMRLPEPADDSEDLDRSIPVNRLTLREVLLAGLDDVVRFGQEFTRYEHLPDGTVRAHFADGGSATGDVLVAADGVGSRVRRQLLPQAAVVDGGVRSVYGRTPLTAESWRLVPAPVRLGFTAVMGRRQQGMALGLMEFRRRPEQVAEDLWPGLRLRPQADYLMWALTAPGGRYPGSDEEMEALDGPALQQVVLDLTRGWHPDLRGLVERAEPAETFYLVVRTSVPIDHWETGNVTLLGDAIHAMSPAGGSGANTALLDAGLLCADLVAVALGRRPLLKAIRDYEERMVGYGFDAVRASEEASTRYAGHRQGPQHPWLAQQIGCPPAKPAARP
jgi:2-polyprenyl-6-methoxyphenol hydroxylase-like FAD-dependent oxidoreductase